MVWTQESYHNSVNCDRPGECSPEKDCLRSHWLTFRQPERKSSSESLLKQMLALQFGEADEFPLQSEARAKLWVLKQSEVLSTVDFFFQLLFDFALQICLFHEQDIQAVPCQKRAEQKSKADACSGCSIFGPVGCTQGGGGSCTFCNLEDTFINLVWNCRWLSLSSYFPCTTILKQQQD